MADVRYRKVGGDSFFGWMIYDRIVPKDHFLMRLDAIVPWERLGRRLLVYYQGHGLRGAPSYNPVVILKMLLLSHLYALSDRDTEELVNFNMVAKCFVGLAADEPAPDYSTVALFRSRLKERKKSAAAEMLFNEVVGLAKEKGIQFGSIQVVDSVHVVADVNTDKDDGRVKSGEEPRDPDAEWGCKGKRLKHDDQGNPVKQPEYFHGFKLHCSYNEASGQFTSATCTPGNKYDGHELPKLVEKDLKQGIPVQIVTADRGYDDGDNHEYLRVKKLKDAIHLNNYRTDKPPENCQLWLHIKREPEYRQGIKKRYKIEQKFGEAKTQHGLRRCRYIGLAGFFIQGFLTLIVMNLKRMVQLLSPAWRGVTAPISI
jgi:IS5 family transposase